MNDNEIIKALECCIWSINNEHQLCPSCPYYERDCSEEVAKDALDLINRQKAEIERLKKIAADTAQRYLDKHAQYIDALSERDEIRTEAIKDFAERLRTEIADALKSNYKAKTEHIEKHYKCLSCDLLATIIGKIDALRGIDDYIDNLVKEMTGETNGK